MLVIAIDVIVIRVIGTRTVIAGPDPQSMLRVAQSERTGSRIKSGMTAEEPGMTAKSSGLTYSIRHCGPDPQSMLRVAQSERTGSRIKSGMTVEEPGMTAKSSGLTYSIRHCGPRPAIHVCFLHDQIYNDHAGVTCNGSDIRDYVKMITND